MKEMSFVSSLYHYIRPSKNEASQPLIGITWKPFLMSESDRTAKLPPRDMHQSSLSLPNTQ